MLSLTDAMTAQGATAATKARGATHPLPYLVQAMYGGAFIGVAVMLMFRRCKNSLLMIHAPFGTMRSFS